MLLNFGCGGSRLEGFAGLDSVDGSTVDIVIDIDNVGDACALTNDSCSFIYMSHVLEHLKNPLWVMEELWRICRPGGLLLVRVPHGSSEEAWIDPTHKRPYFERSFLYFSQPKYHKFDYGYKGDWEAINIIRSSWSEQQGSYTELVCLMRCVKPGRKRDIKLMKSPMVSEYRGKSVGDIEYFLMASLLGRKIVREGEDILNGKQYQRKHIYRERVGWIVDISASGQGELCHRIRRRTTRDICHIKEYHNCMIMPGKGSIVTLDGIHLRGLWSFPLNWWRNDYIEYERSGIGRLRLKGLTELSCRIVEGHGLILGVTSHFGHFFVDCLDRLLQLSIEDIKSFDYVIVDAKPQDYQYGIIEDIMSEDMCEVLKDKVIWPTNGKEVLFLEKACHTPLDSSKSTFSKKIVSSARHSKLYSRFDKCVSNVTVVINRNYASKRRVRGLSKNEFINGIEFNPFICENYREQVELFARAERVVAPMCSELYNLIWCKSGVELILIVGEDYLRMNGASLSHFISLAHECASRLRIKIVKEVMSVGEPYDRDLLWGE